MLDTHAKRLKNDATDDFPLCVSSQLEREKLMEMSNTLRAELERAVKVAHSYGAQIARKGTRDADLGQISSLLLSCHAMIAEIALLVRACSGRSIVSSRAGKARSAVQQRR